MRFHEFLRIESCSHVNKKSLPKQIQHDFIRLGNESSNQLSLQHEFHLHTFKPLMTILFGRYDQVVNGKREICIVTREL